MAALSSFAGRSAATAAPTAEHHTAPSSSACARAAAEQPASTKRAPPRSSSAESAPRQLPVQAQRPPRFDLDTQREEFLAFLDEHGYAVVASVADQAQVARAKALFWDHLEAVPNTAVRRDNVDSWGHRSWLPSSETGILSGSGVGQSDFMWMTRLLPKVKQAFAAIWNTDDLLVSFDGANAFRPWRYRPEWRTDGGWYHIDQNALRPRRQGKVCVQGVVTFTAANEHTGGLVVLPGSHHCHEAICGRSKQAKMVDECLQAHAGGRELTEADKAALRSRQAELAGDYVRVYADDPVLAEADHAALICAEPGDLLLWDSRTVHCNTPALTADGSAPPAAPERWELLRIAAYVCMTPGILATPEVVKARQGLFQRNCTSTHWPHELAVSGGSWPNQPDRDPTAISQEQRDLIGFDRTEFAESRGKVKVGCAPS